MTTPNSAVSILDRIVLPKPQVGPWLQRWRTDYLPAARSRGMKLERLWRAHTGPDTVALHVLWSLPDVGAFFQMRYLAGTDPQLTSFWADTDALAVERERRALEPMEVDA